MTSAPESGPHILIVEARFYDDIVDQLVDCALKQLDAAGASYERITVPGALEIPAAIRFALDVGKDGKVTSRFDGFLPLGCVIRGETSHYDHIVEECFRGLQDLAVRHGLAMGVGVLTVETREQADRRAAPERGDKGGTAARACLEMIKLKADFARRGGR